MLEDAVWGPRIEFMLFTTKKLLLDRLTFGGTPAMITAHAIINAQKEARNWLTKAGIIG